ncbi:MAG: DUF6503 family protein [Bacteroidota bacterium]
MKIFYFFLFFLSLFLVSCATTQRVKVPNNRPLSKAIKSHGGKKYPTAAIEFEFRKGKYSFQNNYGNYRYTSTKMKDGQKIVDVLTNEGFTRYIDGVEQNLLSKDALKFGNSLNSVIYFAQLPYKLDDPAVTQKEIGTTTIKGKSYKLVEVTFAEEGGGTDYDDTYYYWINQKTHLIDYLAYNFHVNGGGVRFRSAYNPRKVGGIHFQDYINYKADKGTPLADLPELYEKGQLKELSKIELAHIRVMKLGALQPLFSLVALDHEWF